MRIGKYDISTIGRERYSVSSVFLGPKGRVPLKIFIGKTVKEAENQAASWARRKEENDG